MGVSSRGYDLTAVLHGHTCIHCRLKLWIVVPYATILKVWPSHLPSCPDLRTVNTIPLRPTSIPPDPLQPCLSSGPALLGHRFLLLPLRLPRVSTQVFPSVEAHSSLRSIQVGPHLVAWRQDRSWESRGPEWTPVPREWVNWSMVLLGMSWELGQGMQYWCCTKVY